MVLLIVAAGWVALRRWNWFLKPGFVGSAVMMAAGLLLAVLVEWIAVHILGRWQYTDTMPQLPGLNIGLVQIAQMLILPPVIFRLVTFIRTMG